MLVEIGAICNEMWIPGGTSDVILGVWPEDGNTYELLVPPQIRGNIIEMQNKLCRTFQRLDNAKRAIARYETELKAVLGD